MALGRLQDQKVGGNVAATEGPSTVAVSRQGCKDAASAPGASVSVSSVSIVSKTLPSKQRSSPRKELARIPDAFLDLLKDRSDIVSVVSRRVSLRKAGSVMEALCPFHTEKSPSFTVSPTRQTYHCFGCGAHGNALGFLIEHDGTPFRQAVKDLAGEMGIQLPPEMTEEGVDAVDTAPLYAAMAMAHKYFRHVLGQTPDARAYLKGRGLSSDMLKRFLIGFAPAEWRGLKEAFPDYETNADILTVGLIREKEREQASEVPPTQDLKQELKQELKQPHRYDTFRNRITFGIRDTRGRIAAFGGRIVGEGEPKYMNSPETPIFDKSGSLFGLFEAREQIRARKEVLVVEGYMDVVMLAQHGVEHSVATMGTACTRWHIERLLTQASRVVFCFDGDKAGQAAAWKALNTCAEIIQDDHDFRFLVLPDGLDPDDYVRKNGKAAFEALVLAAPGFTEFLITAMQQRHGITPGTTANTAGNAELRARFAAEATQVAERISYGVKLRRIVLDQISTESRLPGTALKAIRQRSHVPKNRTIWSVLLAACEVAPATAREHRREVLELLDSEDENERELSEVLASIPEEASDQVENTDFLLARDGIRGAIDLILRHREKAAREEIGRQHAAGEISDAEYLVFRQTLSGR